MRYIEEGTFWQREGEKRGIVTVFGNSTGSGARGRLEATVNISVDQD